MIKIIKAGVEPDITFTCDFCRTIFKADKDDYIISNTSDAFCCSCPTCKNDCYVDKNTVLENAKTIKQEPLEKQETQETSKNDSITYSLKYASLYMLNEALAIGKFSCPYCGVVYDNNIAVRFAKLPDYPDSFYCPSCHKAICGYRKINYELKNAIRVPRYSRDGDAFECPYCSCRHSLWVPRVNGPIVGSFLCPSCDKVITGINGEVLKNG